MALTGIDRGTGGNTTASTLLSIVPAQNFAAGSMAILMLAYDNAGTQGADPFLGISDTSSNSWTNRQTPTNDPGAASAGVSFRLITCTVGTLGTGTTIAITFNTSVTAKAWTLTEVTAASGFAPSHVQGSSNTGSNTSAQITTGTLTSGNLFVAGTGSEGSSTMTGDSDTVNGTWSTQQTTVFGTTTSGVHVSSQYKLLTASGAQTYNVGLGTTEDWAVAWIEITEVATTPATSFDPMGMMGFFGM